MVVEHGVLGSRQSLAAPLTIEGKHHNEDTKFALSSHGSVTTPRRSGHKGLTPRPTIRDTRDAAGSSCDAAVIGVHDNLGRRLAVAQMGAERG